MPRVNVLPSQSSDGATSIGSYYLGNPLEPVLENEVYTTIGDEGFQRICAAFYRRVATDGILGPMYPADDLDGAEQRLRSFLIYRFGGPQDYLSQRGHPRLRMRHAPFAIDMAARDRWVELMRAAVDESDIPQNAAATLHVFFEHMATFLVNRQQRA